MALAAAFAPIPEDVVEQAYGRGLYPHVQRILTTASNLAPVALLDPAALGVLAVLAVRAASRLRRSGLKAAAASCLADLLVVLAASYMWFLVTWGLHYRRQPIERRLDFDPSRAGRAGLIELMQRATRELNRLHGEANRSPWPELAKVGAILDEPLMAARTLAGDAWRPVAGRPKRSLLEWYFRQSGVDGMTDPFFLEVLINPDVLPFERPYVVAHESAHLGGYADEAEASFVAWVACTRAGPQPAYSAWISLYSTLAAAVPAAERASRLGELADGPRRDLRAIRERLGRASPLVREAAWRAYDRYLKANRVDEGAGSYARVARLMAGTRIPANSRFHVPRSRLDRTGNPEPVNLRR